MVEDKTNLQGDFHYIQIIITGICWAQQQRQNAACLQLHSRESHYIFVFTPERLLHYFSVASNPSIEYVFVDEAQKVLSADTRSVVYYHAISLAERKSCKLFFSSPNISNVDVFLKLFNKTSTETKTVTESPVCQTRVFVDMIARRVQLFSDIDEVYTEIYQLPNTLPELIQKISVLDNICHIRLLYCYPEMISEREPRQVRRLLNIWDS